MLPDCLSQLTGLQQLRLAQNHIRASHAGALGQLSKLTCLALLKLTAEHGVALPPLPQLRALAWDVFGGGAPMPLPPGTWLSALQHLETSDSRLAASLPTLAHATSLTLLSVQAVMTPATQADDVQQLAGILRCVALLPQLSAVEVYVGSAPGIGAAAPAALHEALAGSPARLLWSNARLLDGVSALDRLFEDDDDD